MVKTYNLTKLTTNPINTCKIRGRTQVFRKGKQFLVVHVGLFLFTNPVISHEGEQLLWSPLLKGEPQFSK